MPTIQEVAIAANPERTGPSVCSRHFRETKVSCNITTKMAAASGTVNGNVVNTPFAVSVETLVENIPATSNRPAITCPRAVSAPNPTGRSGVGSTVRAAG